MPVMFHIGPQTPLTVGDVVAALNKPAEVLEKHFPGALAILEGRKIKLESSHLFPAISIRKAQQVLGWKPKFTFEGWLRANGWQGGG